MHALATIKDSYKLPCSFDDGDFIILLVACPSNDCIKDFDAQLAREFEKKDLRPPSKILGDADFPTNK